MLFEYWIHMHKSRIFNRVLAQKYEFFWREWFDVANTHNFCRRSHFDNETKQTNVGKVNVKAKPKVFRTLEKSWIWKNDGMKFIDRC